MNRKYFIREFRPSKDLIDDILTSKNLPFIRWEGRDGGGEWIGIGCLEKFHSLGNARIFLKELNVETGSITDIRCFGAFPFDRSRWEREASLLLPQWILKLEKKSWSGCEILTDPEKTSTEEGLKNYISNSNEDLSFYDKMAEYRLDPEYEVWQQQVNTILNGIQNGSVNKVVLSRQQIMKTKSELGITNIFSKIQKNQINSYLFQIPKDSGQFVGVSPERLFRIEGNMLNIDSLAGTRKRSVVRAEDSRLERELLESKKERHEQNIVTKSILKTIEPFITNQPELSKVKVKKFSKVQHLHSNISAILKDSANVDDLLKALHPTPALGGDPKEKALGILQEIGEPDRGYYGGPVGWISADKMEFAVGIRSALIKKDEVILYGGCGIVHGSDPEAEWDETQVKMSVMENAIFGDSSDST